MRDLQLTLLADGGAEVLDVDAPADAEPLWASDSDEEFGEEFPELLDENDVEHLLDYLEEHEVCTSRELEVMEVITEPFEDDDELDFGGDVDDDDDEDEDAPWNDPDTVDGEVIEHE